MKKNNGNALSSFLRHCCQTWSQEASFHHVVNDLRPLKTSPLLQLEPSWFLAANYSELLVWKRLIEKSNWLIGQPEPLWRKHARSAFTVSLTWAVKGDTKKYK